MDRSRKNRVWSVVMIVCCVIAALCVAAILYIAAQRRITEQVLHAAEEDVRAAPPVTAEHTPAPAGDTTAETVPEEDLPELVEVPIDFTYLTGINEDVRAWLVMPVTGQEYPVLMRMNDDEYYLDRGIRGEYSADGSLFMQSLFNTGDFSDPCTVIYGHNMASGAMFGNLGRTLPTMDLSDAEDPDNYLTVYTPHGIRTYRIQCAGRFSNENILFGRDFSDPEQAERFFTEFRMNSEENYWQNDSFRPESGQRYLVLSTCFRRNAQYRFLVVAELTEQQGY